MCDIDCLNDQVNTTISTGKLTLKIMTIVSQNEIEKSSEKVIRAILCKYGIQG